MTGIGDQIDTVAAAIREISAVEVLARFGRLSNDEIDEKSPGDLVTIADRACEAALTDALRSIIDVPVVGEEAAATDPNMLDLVEAAPAVWVVDPVDGTGNFAAGNPNFAVMVAFVEAGDTTAGWIWLPTSDRLVTAHVGAGTFDDGKRVEAAATATDIGGVIKYRYVPEPGRTSLAAVAASLPPGTDRRCAGVEYLDLVDGASSFLAYWRTQPWDHAPGTIIASEAGLRSGRFNGDRYRPGDGHRGLLTARPDRFDELANQLDEAVAV